MTDGLRWHDVACSLEQQITLREDPAHHVTSLRSGSRRDPGAWIVSILFWTACSAPAPDHDPTGSGSDHAPATGDAASTSTTVRPLRAMRGRAPRARCS